VGTFALAGAAECAPCLKGSYSAAPGASRCELADAGTFVPDDGAAAVVPCFEGEYAPFSGAISCERCGAGTYVTDGATRCEICPPGVNCTGQVVRGTAIGWWAGVQDPSDPNPSVNDERYECRPMRGLRSERCAGGTAGGDGLCMVGHTGALCGRCDVGYHATYDWDGALCLACPANGSSSNYFAVLATKAVNLSDWPYLAELAGVDDPGETHLSTWLAAFGVSQAALILLLFLLLCCSACGGQIDAVRRERRLRSNPSQESYEDSFDVAARHSLGGGAATEEAMSMARATAGSSRRTDTSQFVSPDPSIPHDLSGGGASGKFGADLRAAGIVARKSVRPSSAFGSLKSLSGRRSHNSASTPPVPGGGDAELSPMPRSHSRLSLRARLSRTLSEKFVSPYSISPSLLMRASLVEGRRACATPRAQGGEARSAEPTSPPKAALPVNAGFKGTTPPSFRPPHRQISPSSRRISAPSAAAPAAVGAVGRPADGDVGDGRARA